MQIKAKIDVVWVAVIFFSSGIILGLFFYFKFGPVITGGIAKVSLTLLSVMFSGLIGYLIGAVKSFREEKQKVYGEILPPFVRISYTNNPTADDEREFNRALAKLWLYANKDVAFKVDMIASILVKRDRGNLGEAIQEAIVAMREDIHHRWPFSRIKPDQVKHLFFKIGKL